jgi:hypothetical protein
MLRQHSKEQLVSCEEFAAEDGPIWEPRKLFTYSPSSLLSRDQFFFAHSSYGRSIVSSGGLFL